MPWTKFPNQMNDLRKLRRALQVAESLAPAEVADDERYGYALLDAGVIRVSRPVEEVRILPASKQGPITTGRALPQMLLLLEMLERTPDGGLALTAAAKAVASQEGSTLGAREIAAWREAVLGLHYQSDGVDMRPAWVALKMLGAGPLPSQSLALAFAAASESEQEISRLRALAETWQSDVVSDLASECGTTVSELRNNAKVLPGLLEQCGLIVREQGAARVEPLGLETLGQSAAPSKPNQYAGSSQVQPRPITEGQPRAWAPAPVDPDDAAEAALLRRQRLERASASHEKALQAIAKWLRTAKFETLESNYDILAKRRDMWLLIEVKSITERNARGQTITAIGQLAFYYYDVSRSAPTHIAVHRLVGYQRPCHDPKILGVLDQEGIVASWIDGSDYFVANAELFQAILGDS